MVLDVLLITTTLIVLTIAAYADIKSREIPDWLNFSFIAAAFGIRGIISTTLGWQIFLAGLIGFVVCFALACLFYYSNQWGGGDSKLLMGMGSAIGISLPLSAESLDLLWFFLALLFFGAIWGIFWMIAVAIKKRHLFIVRLKKSLEEQRVFHLVMGVGTSLLIVLSLIYSFLWPLILFPAIIFYSIIFVTSVEKSCFFVRKKSSELTEGDWLAENATKNGKRIVTKRTLTKNDIELLKSKKITSVLIKEGIPFVPSFLIAYLVIKFFSSLMSRILQAIF